MRKTRTTVYGNERKLFYGALSLLLVVFATYIYFVSSAIVHVIVRKEVTQEIAQLSSHVSDLETAYIEAKHDLDEDAIATYGFAPIDERIFVKRAPTNLVLSLGDES